MLFIYPMWKSETERLGKKRCSPLAYNIHILADYIGFLGLILLITMIITKIITSYIDSWWYFSIPFLVGFLGGLTHIFSWYLVSRKKFEYNYKKDESKWIENEVEIFFNK